MMLTVLAKFYFPGQPVTPELMGEALFIDKRQREMLASSVNNGICTAFET